MGRKPSARAGCRQSDRGLLESKVTMRDNLLPMQSVTCWLKHDRLKHGAEQSCSVVRLGLGLGFD